MDELTPTYSIAVPTNILKDRNISPTAKLLYGVIDSFLRRSGVCYATNERLAEEVAGCSERTISRCVSELMGAGYVALVAAKPRKLILTVSAPDGQEGEQGGVLPRQNCLPTSPILSTHLDKNGDKVNNKSKKEKKKAFDPLPVFVSWIQGTFPQHSADDKNELYLKLVEYAEMRADSKSPLNTQRKVNGLLEDLLEQSEGSFPVMREMLTTAKRRCWLSVHAPKDKQPEKPEKASGGRKYDSW